MSTFLILGFAVIALFVYVRIVSNISPRDSDAEDEATSDSAPETSLTPSPKLNIKKAKNKFSSLVSEKDSDFYAIAEKEVNDENTVQGIWSLALVNAQGNENLRKIEYMKLRAKQLKRDMRKEPLQTTGKRQTTLLLKRVLNIIAGLIIFIIIGTAPAWIIIVTAMYNEYILGIEPAGRHEVTISVLKRINNGEGSQIERSVISDAFDVCFEYNGNNKELISLCKEVRNKSRP